MGCLFSTQPGEMVGGRNGLFAVPKCCAVISIITSSALYLSCFHLLLRPHVMVTSFGQCFNGVGLRSGHILVKTSSISMSLPRAVETSRINHGNCSRFV